MIATANTVQTPEYSVVHPMFDEPEAKCNGAELGLMKMTAGTRFCLVMLRAYLVGMSLLFAYHMLDMAGVFHHGK